MVVKKGGKKNKRNKRGAGTDGVSRYLPTAQADERQMYAFATKMLGNRRITVKCADNKSRMAIIPGKYKGRRHWIEEDMLLLLNLREFEDHKADVIYIYSAQDANRLRRKGELDDFDDDHKEKEEQNSAEEGATEGVPSLNYDGFEFNYDSEEDNSQSSEKKDSSVYDIITESSTDSDVDIDLL